MNDSLERITMEQFKNVIDTLEGSMDDYLYIFDLQNDGYYISRSAAERFLLPGEEFHDVIEQHKQFVYAEDIPLLETDLMLILEGKKELHDMQYRWLDKNHCPIWINCRGRLIRSENGTPEYLVGCINEIGKKQMADNVSGLLREASLNRDILEQEGRLNGFMLRIGIDRFKEINENKGMEYGDMILRRTAECIASVIEPHQRLYRIVADEFVVVDFEGSSADEAIRLYELIREKINSFIEDNRYEVFYTVSAGIMEFEAVTNQSYHNLMKLSEFALGEAKNNGKNRYYIYTKADYHIFTHKKELTKILRQAINEDFKGFAAYFQPIVSIREQRLIGMETLMRFSCEEKGSIGPYEFVPILEDSGLIIPVGKWILFKAMEACKEIQKKIRGFRVSVNISYIQVLRSNVLADILEGLKKYDLDPGSLVIELTESGFLAENENFIHFCDGLKKYGIALALDDFGTGYSNFQYLSYLRPNTIKIDRSFTMKALKSDYEYGLLRHMVDMTHSIESNFCIEGVETEEELRKVCEMGTDYIQGFYFGKPCAYDEFTKIYVR